MTDVELNVAKQFSEYPFGRYAAHGEANGSRFRDELLIPALKHDGYVTVDLTGARGLAASFLEEAFGGLIRAGFKLEDLESRLKIKSETDESFIDETWEYIRDAASEEIGD